MATPLSHPAAAPDLSARASAVMQSQSLSVALIAPLHPFSDSTGTMLHRWLDHVSTALPHTLQGIPWEILGIGVLAMIHQQPGKARMENTATPPPATLDRFDVGAYVVHQNKLYQVLGVTRKQYEGKLFDAYDLKAVETFHRMVVWDTSSDALTEATEQDLQSIQAARALHSVEAPKEVPAKESIPSIATDILRQLITKHFGHQALITQDLTAQGIQATRGMVSYWIRSNYLLKSLAQRMKDRRPVRPISSKYPGYTTLLHLIQTHHGDYRKIAHALTTPERATHKNEVFRWIRQNTMLRAKAISARVGKPNSPRKRVYASKNPGEAALRKLIIAHHGNTIRIAATLNVGPQSVANWIHASDTLSQLTKDLQKTHPYPRFGKNKQNNARSNRLLAQGA